MENGGALTTNYLNIYSWLHQNEGGTYSDGSGDGGYVKVSGIGSSATVASEIELGSDGYIAQLGVLDGGSVSSGRDLNMGESAHSTHPPRTIRTPTR